VKVHPATPMRESVAVTGVDVWRAVDKTPAAVRRACPAEAVYGRTARATIEVLAGEL